jgi:hypothetical protein
MHAPVLENDLYRHPPTFRMALSSPAGEGNAAAQGVLAGIEDASQRRKDCARVQEMGARHLELDDAIAW